MTTEESHHGIEFILYNVATHGFLSEVICAVDAGAEVDEGVAGGLHAGDRRQVQRCLLLLQDRGRSGKGFASFKP